MHEPRKTLIVDIDEISAKIAEDMLTSLGIHDTLIMHDYDEAKQFIEKNRIFMVVIEIGMGGIRSFNFIKWLRRGTGNHNFQAPIIAYSENPTKEMVSAARDAGITEFAARPFDKQILKDILNTSMVKPRNFIIARNYSGPDRRRKTKPLTTAERRVNPDKKDE
jgi:two-component system chemotaxis response regulator CheY